MLSGVTGYLGSGKTLYLAFLGDMVTEDTDIYTNFTLRLPNATQVGVEDLEGIDEGLLLIDEAYTWLDSRMSTSKVNKYLSHFLMMSRKRGFDIIMSAQLESMFDLRFRHLQDVEVFAMGEKEVRSGNDTIDVFQYVVYGWGNAKKYNIPKSYCERRLFDIFDTDEVVEPDVSIFEPERYDRVVQGYVDELREEYSDKVDDLTKGMIKDILIRKGETNSDIWDAVYDRLKLQVRL